MITRCYFSHAVVLVVGAGIGISRAVWLVADVTRRSCSALVPCSRWLGSFSRKDGGDIPTSVRMPACSACCGVGWSGGVGNAAQWSWHRSGEFLRIGIIELSELSEYLRIRKASGRLSETPPPREFPPPPHVPPPPPCCK